MHRVISRVLMGAVAALCSLSAVAATAPADPVPLQALYAAPAAPWSRASGPEYAITRGGALRFRWNQQLLGDLGIGEASAIGGPSAVSERGIDFQLSPDSHFEIKGSTEVAHEVASGEAMLQGGFSFAKIALNWQNPRLTVRGGAEARIDFLSDDGEVWFYADRLMYEFLDDGSSFRLRSADLRVSAALAQLLGRAEAADLAVAELRLLASVVQRATAAAPRSCADPNWTGKAVPNTSGGIYTADVFMSAFSAQFSRCQSCDGPGNANDGSIVFTPSSTLKNNINNASLTTPVVGATIPGDPLGTSAALYAADVPWYEKFTVSPWNFPYTGNDQHPYLIWNLYRLDSNGAITQVGRSGVKHAFLTTNGGCAEGSCSSHILGRSCSDTYGTGNNDNSADLGPRSEIIPADGVFGRCGSIFDPNCDGIENGGAASSFDQRMLVKESAIDPAVNTGATYLFESWYLAHLDVNIYNTMATRPVSFQWSGSTWPLNNNPPGSTGFKLGSAIDRWLDAAAAPSLRRIGEIAVKEGHAKVAIKVTDLGDGRWRYHYAVMNFDFARAVTSGREDDHTLRVLSNNGFNRFAVPRNAAATITELEFADGDSNGANNWSGALEAGHVVWQAPNAASSLNWGSLYRFTFVANTPPVEIPVTLDVTESGAPSSFEVPSLGTGAQLSVSAPSTLSLVEDGNSALAVSVFDTETPAASLELAAASSNQGLIPDASLVLGGSGSNRTVQIAPLANQFGTTQITLTVTDGDSNTAVDVVDVTVQPVNDAPSFTVGTLAPHSVANAGPVSQPGFVTGVSFGGGENQAVLGYQVAETSDPSNVVSGAAIATNGTLTYTLSGAPGTAQLSARVRDDGGTANGGVDLSGAVTFTVIVIDQLRISAPSGTTIDEDQSAGLFSVTVSDAETAPDALIVTGSSSNPALLPQSGIVLGGSGGSRTLQLNPAPDASGTVAVTLTVTDGDNNQATATLNLTVRAVNDAPSFTTVTLPNHAPRTPGPRTVAGFVSSVDFGGGESQAVQSYQVVEVSDPDNVASSVSLAADGTLSYVLADAIGAATYSVVLRDNGGTANGGVDQSTPATFTIQVVDALRVLAASSSEINEDAVSLTLGVTVGDLETPAAQLQLSASSSNATLLPPANISLGGSGAARQLTLVPAANRWGEVDVTLTVTDTDNNTASRVVRVNVLPVNDAPTLTVATLPPRPAGTSGQLAVAGFVASLWLGDYETQAVAEYLVTEISDPNGIVSGAVILPNGTLVHQLSGNSGTARLSARVRDDGGTANGGADTSAPREFDVVVEAPPPLLQDGFEDP